MVPSDVVTALAYVDCSIGGRRERAAGNGLAGAPARRMTRFRSLSFIPKKSAVAGAAFLRPISIRAMAPPAESTLSTRGGGRTTVIPPAGGQLPLPAGV